MNVFFAGYLSFLSDGASEVEVTRSADVTHVLESFYYMNPKALKEIESGSWTMFLDSGAYSAFSRNATIDLKEYIEFYHAYREKFQLVAALDVIGDAHASWENYKEMVACEVPAIPCFHYGEPYQFLEQMVEEAPYIAIGGVAQLGSGPALIEWLDTVWSRVVDEEGRPRVKVHGFAVTGLQAMLRYPWTSVDSTAWLQMAGHGTVSLDLRNGDNRITDIKIAFSDRSPHSAAYDKHFDSLRPAYQQEVRRYLESLGYDIENIRRSYRWRQHVNIGYFRRCAERAPERFFRQQQGLFF